MPSGDCRRSRLSGSPRRVLEAPFDVGPDFTWRPRLVSSVDFTKKPPFTLTYHIRPEAHWSDGVRRSQRADFVFTHRAILKHGQPDDSEPDARFAASARSTRRPSGSCCDHASRVGAASSEASCRGTRCAGEDLTSVWRDRIENPKTGSADRERPLPRRALGARQADHAPSQPSVLGAARGVPRPNRHSLRGRRWATLGRAGFGAAEFDVAAGFPPSFVPDLSVSRGLETSPFPARGGITSRSASVRAAIPLSGASSSAARSPSASTAVRSLARAVRGHRRAGTADATARLPDPRAATTGRTGATTATARPRRAGCSSWRAAAAVRTASTSARASGSRSAS